MSSPAASPAQLQARIIPIFHYALRADGFLFLGLSETIARHGDLFAQLDKHHFFSAEIDKSLQRAAR